MHARDGAVVYRRVDHDNPEPARPNVAYRPPSHPQPHLLSLLQAAHPAGERLIQTLPPAAVRAEVVSQEADWHTAWVAARASADGGELDLAEEHCQQAIARAQLRPEPYYLWGTLRQARGDDAGSLEALRKALYVDPAFVPALVAQAAIHRRGGAPARAHQALVRAHRLLEGRVADEWVLPDDGLTVGRLRDAVDQALATDGFGA
jgi:chemotaxis protein methyltransferase CheR